MVGTTQTIGRIAMRRQNDFSLQHSRTVNSSVEVVDLKPEGSSVPIRPHRRIAYLPVVVLNIKGM